MQWNNPTWLCIFSVWHFLQLNGPETKGIGTDRYKLVPGVDGKDYSSKLKWLEGGGFSTEFAVLANKRAEASCQFLSNLHWSCVMCSSQASTHPAYNGICKNCVCTSAETRQMACLQPNSIVTCWHYILRGHCSDHFRRADCSFLGTEDVVETCMEGITMSHPALSYQQRPWLAAGVVPPKETLSCVLDLDTSLSQLFL